MENGIVYLRPNRRKPVRLHPVCFTGDPQQDVPAGWCADCGQEVYSPHGVLCRRCERIKGDLDGETSEPL